MQDYDSPVDWRKNTCLKCKTVLKKVNRIYSQRRNVKNDKIEEYTCTNKNCEMFNRYYHYDTETKELKYFGTLFKEESK